MRAVIFDMDGVLVDSERMHEKAIRASCAAVGAPPPLPDWQEYVGLGDRDAFAKVYADAGRASEATDEVIARLLDEKKARTTRMIAEGDSWSAQPGAVELVRAATMAGPAAVCSGARAFEVLGMLDAARVLRLLHAVVTADDCVRTKPDPFPYLLAAERLGVSPRECVVIEDTTIGVRAAKAAGMACVAVEHTSPRQRLLSAGADAVVARIDGLTIAGLRDVWSRGR